jgi:hypothetical protein
LIFSKALGALCPQAWGTPALPRPWARPGGPRLEAKAKGRWRWPKAGGKVQRPEAMAKGRRPMAKGEAPKGRSSWARSPADCRYAYSRPGQGPGRAGSKGRIQFLPPRTNLTHGCIQVLAMRGPRGMEPWSSRALGQSGLGAMGPWSRMALEPSSPGACYRIIFRQGKYKETDAETQNRTLSVNYANLP